MLQVYDFSLKLVVSNTCLRINELTSIDFLVQVLDHLFILLTLDHFLVKDKFGMVKLNHKLLLMGLNTIHLSLSLKGTDL